MSKWSSDIPAGMNTANGARPVSTSPPPHAPLISPTGSPGLNSVIDVVNNTAAPFMSAPPPEQGAAGWVAQGLGGVLGVVGAPMMIIDTAFASLTAPIAALFPGMPALTLGAMHVAPPHTHTHPPSLIPPAPPVPLPSLGVTLGSGSVTVLIGGMPAARAGDIGLAVTCGSLAPPFEIFTGSSNVFIGGARAARMLDLTKHCNPTSMGPFAIAMGAAGVVAGAAGGIATGNAYAAAQAAADAAVLAIKLLCGKDPGLPPGMGALVGPPVANVLIGGFPCPPIGEMAMGGIIKMIGKAAKALKNARNARRGNSHCGDASEPIYLPTGENFNSFVDFVSGGLFQWRRHYTTARNREDGPLGFGWRHFLQRSLSVRLHRATFTDWDGVRIAFPRFPRGSDITRADGYVLRRIARGHYRISTIGEPTMEFVGGEFEGELPLTKLIAESGELALQYDRNGLLAACVEWQFATPRDRRRWELHRDSDGHIAEIVEGGGGGPGGAAAGAPIVRAAFGYSKNGELARVRDALQGQWAYEYDGFHRLTKQTDPRSYSYSWKYDLWGRCIEASGQDGLWWAKFDYFPQDKFTRYTEGDDASYDFYYEDDGFVSKIVDPYGGETIRERDAEGRLVRELDSGGREMRCLYDGDDAHHGRIDEYGNVYPPEFEMPSLPKVASHDVPATPLERQFAGLTAPQKLAVHGAAPAALEVLPESLREWARRNFRVRGTGAAIALPPPRQEIDALGRVVREIDSAGRVRQWHYDGTGNVVATTDRDGHVTRNRITSWNLVGEVTNPLGHSMRYRYSKLEKVIGVSDPLGNTTRYDYDKKERLVRVHRHGRVRDEYVYDVGDHLVEKRDGRGEVLFKCTPHAKHLVGTRELAVGGVHRLDYDRRGRVTEASTKQNEVRLGRDLFGRRVHDVRDGTGVHHRHVWHEDDRGPRRTTTVLDRFSIVEEPQADGSTIVIGPAGDVTHLRFDPSGVVARRVSNGSLELAQYDDEGRLESRVVCKPGGNGAAQSWSTRYSYTAEGDLLRVADSWRGTTTFEVDAAHRLVGEATPDGRRLVYELDAADNVISKPGLLRAEVAAGNRLAATEHQLFEYDARDHISVRRGRDGSVTRYVYDSLDMLVRIERAGADGRELPAITYAYDAIGRRLLAKGEQTREFHWDGDRLAAEVFPDGKLRVYTYAGHDALVPIAFTDYADGQADPRTGAHYHVFSDQIGMPLHIEDAQGRAVWWASRIDPYGAIEVHASSTLEYNLRWPGHYFDADTGLHYNRYRYYDPVLGRYLQSDPSGYEGSDVNLYGYVPNPLVDVDVLGLHGGRRDRSRKMGDDGQEGDATAVSRPATAGETSPVTGKPVAGAAKVVEMQDANGNTVARYYLDDTGRIVHAEGQLDPPPSRVKEGVGHVMPDDFESGRDHRGHLIPERSAANQDAVNVPENVISEHGTQSNLSTKKQWENRARANAEDDPGGWSTHTPHYDGDGRRPTSVTHNQYGSDGQPVPGMEQNIPNPT